MSHVEATDRPAASGHRFGPDLVCTECGMGWDQHQRDPHPCSTELEANAFDRRPEAVDVPPARPGSAPSPAPRPAGAPTDD